MALRIKPFSRYNQPKMAVLIQQFNDVSESDHIQRLFYLQKINFLLNKTYLNENLFNWIDQSEKNADSWQAHLLSYSINPDASFLFKGIQFAKAVADNLPKPIELDENDIYKLMQQRDKLLKSDSPFEEIREQYIAISSRLEYLVQTDVKIKNTLEKHTKILALAKDKISAIKGNTDQKSPDYVTVALSERRVNNFNYKFKMKGWPEALIFRIEDRYELGLEQELHSYPVSAYFGDDAAVFMMPIKSEENNDIEYKPVILSQFANQGNLRDIASRLKGERQGKIAAITKYYFTQLNDFCIKLTEAGVYHPDIKLTNFLVHNNKLLVSDRKTFISNPHPKADEIRATPHLAPPQYIDCLNEDCNDYLQPIAHKTEFDIEQFMAYQVGIALKEFLLTTQMEDLPKEFWESDCIVASKFQNPDRQIINLSLLVQELTRTEEGKRLSIKQFQLLLPFLNQKPEDFYKQVEKILPSSKLGISEQLKQINQLLKNKKLKGDELLEQANPIFIAFSENQHTEPRLAKLMEDLAIKCYTSSSQGYFKKLSHSIEAALLTSDWQKAPWYRKALHFLSFAYYRVDRVTPVDEIAINLDFQDPEFQSHFPQLSFLPSTKLNNLGDELTTTHFKEFFFINLNKIKPQRATESAEDTEQSEHSDHSERSSLLSNASSTLIPPSNPEDDAESDMFEQTLATDEANTQDDFHEDEVSSHTDSNEEHQEDEEAEDGSLIIKANSEEPKEPVEEKPELSDNKKKSPYSFFMGTQDLEQTLIKKKSIRRANSTLFRGERRPDLKSIFATPPAQSPLTEQHSVAAFKLT